MDAALKEKISALSEQELYALENEIKNLRNEKIKKNYLSTLEEYRNTLLGRCFKIKEKEDGIYKYYKCISEYANNECRASFLIFKTLPIVDITKILSKSGYTIDHYKVDLYSFYIDDILVNGGFYASEEWREMQKGEITKEEWEQAFDVHCKALKKVGDKSEKENNNT